MGSRQSQENTEIQQQLLSIEIPILDVATSIAMVPVIGILDSAKTQKLMQKILDHIKDKEVKVTILDISGITIIDSAVAAHLIKITKATKLLGTDTIITGISPDIAQTIVNLGISLNDVLTTSSLKNGLTSAYNILGFEVLRKS